MMSTLGSAPSPSPSQYFSLLLQGCCPQSETVYSLSGFGGETFMVKLDRSYHARYHWKLLAVYWAYCMRKGTVCTHFINVCFYFFSTINSSCWCIISCRTETDKLGMNSNLLLKGIRFQIYEYSEWELLPEWKACSIPFYFPTFKQSYCL